MELLNWKAKGSCILKWFELSHELCFKKDTLQFGITYFWSNKCSAHLKKRLLSKLNSMHLISIHKIILKKKIKILADWEVKPYLG